MCIRFFLTNFFFILLTANLEEYKEANLQGGNKMSNFQENTNTSGEMNPDNVNSRSIQGKVSEGVTSTKSNILITSELTHYKRFV